MHYYSAYCNVQPRLLLHNRQHEYCTKTDVKGQCSHHHEKYTSAVPSFHLDGIKGVFGTERKPRNGSSAARHWLAPTAKQLRASLSFPHDGRWSNRHSSRHGIANYGGSNQSSANTVSTDPPTTAQVPPGSRDGDARGGGSSWWHRPKRAKQQKGQWFTNKKIKRRPSRLHGYCPN